MDVIVTLLTLFPFVFFLSFLFEGIDRKLNARMQRRIGPPIIQPFYDFIKLFGKERIVPMTAASLIFPTVTIIAAASSILAAIIPIANLVMETSIVGDLILIPYLLTMSSIMIMIGGSSSGNPYGAVGFSRKMTLLIGYEVPMLISIVSLALSPNSSLRYYDIISNQIRDGMPLAFTYISNAVAATAFLLCIPAAAESVPFDISEAKSEIIHGTLVEFGGPYLALIKLAKATSNFAWIFLVTTLFFYTPALFQEYVPLGVWGILCLCLITALLFTILTITVPRTIFARLKIGQALKFYWSVPLTLSLISVLLSMVGF